MGVRRIEPMTEEKIDSLLARFTEMCESDAPKAGPTFKAQIETLATKIRMLIKKGYRYADIASVIKEVSGVEMNVATLRNYVPRATKKKASAPARRAKQPKLLEVPE